MASKPRSRIFPHLWYSKEAEEAARFYASIFPDSQVNQVGTALGAGIGTAIGVAAGNIAVGVAIGVGFGLAVGVGFGALSDKRHDHRDDV